MSLTRVVIVDGYNALHRMKALAHRMKASLEDAREGLIAWCRSWLAEHRDVACLLVVFDGEGAQPLRTSAGRLGVLFTPRGRKADDEIVVLAREAGRQCTVVTDDADLARRASSKGAATQKVETFLAIHRRSPRSRRVASDEKPTLARTDRRALEDELRARWL